MAFNSLLVMEVTTNAEDAVKGLQSERDKLSDGKRGAMAAAVGQLQRYATGIAPVDTGRLRNSIFAEVLDGGARGVVATNVVYAPYQEYGTRRGVPATRFFGRTVDAEGAAAMRTYQSILLGV